ncbi:MAG: hypothetical protein ACLU9S_22555 [Oscillospiraceae bacterium]
MARNLQKPHLARRGGFRYNEYQKDTSWRGVPCRRHRTDSFGEENYGKALLQIRGHGLIKAAQALISKYNYEENELKVWLIKPSADVRDGEGILRSRIGLEASVNHGPLG